MKVRIPTPLQAYTGGRAAVQASGATLGEVVKDLDRRYPGLRFRVIDEQDAIRPHVKFFLNGEQLKDLSVRARPSDEVAIVQAFSGG